MIDPISVNVADELLQFMCIMMFGSEAVHENITEKNKTEIIHSYSDYCQHSKRR